LDVVVDVTAAITLNVLDYASGSQI
jgi:hypothetical protein